MFNIKMYIREATSRDNNELIKLQSQCFVGTNPVVAIVNSPDFFARAKAYESYKVFVACEGKRIIASSACAARNANINGEVKRIGVGFQTFVSPEYRRRGIASLLFQHRENYLIRQGVVLTYALVIDKNFPGMKNLEKQGFKLHQTLIRVALWPDKKLPLSSEKIESANGKKLAAIAGLLNETWENYNLYGEASMTSLIEFIRRTPGYSLRNLFVLKKYNKIVACLGYWDWGKITQIVAQKPKISRDTRVDITTYASQTNNIIKRWLLTPIAFKKAGHLLPLLKYINNKAVADGVEQISFICEQHHELLTVAKEFSRVNYHLVHLYVKPLQRGVAMGNKRVFIDGIEL